MIGPSKIYHIADIHCRLYDRHDEYRHVFSKMFERIRELGTDNAIICIAGDLAHVKSEVSSEYFVLLTELIRGCAELCPTIIIPGNHDFIESNRSKMDAITPVVTAMADDRVVYLKNSGVLEIGDVIFSHMSIFDGSEHWPSVDALRSGPAVRRVCMYHGPVEGAVTNAGFSDFGNAMQLKAFDGYDIVLLGDIHKYSALGSGNIVYPSSLVQQDRGESYTGHGFVEWDVEKCTHVFHEITNPYGTMTIYVNDLMVPPNIDVSGYDGVANIVVVYSGVSKDNATNIVDVFKTRYPTSTVKLDFQRTKTGAVEATDMQTAAVVTHTDASSVDGHTTLFSDYFTNSGEVLTDVEFADIMSIHRDYYLKALSSMEVPTSATDRQWTPLCFEWDNMFSYGSGNRVDMTNWSGVIGLFAPNQSGKSNFIDSILYTIFDKCTRTDMSADVMNRYAEYFTGKLRYISGDYTYTITRTGTRHKKGNVSVDVTFERERGGVVEKLTREKRDATNAEIRKYIGTYDDFIFTTLSTISDARTFADMRQSARKEMLYRYLQLDRFGVAYDMADAAHKIKRLDANKYGDIDVIRTDIISTESAIENATDSITASRERLVELEQTLAPLDLNISNVELDLRAMTIPETKQDLELKLNNAKLTVDRLNTQKGQSQAKLNEYTADLNKLVIHDDVKLNQTRLEISEHIQTYNNLHSRQTVLTSEISKHQKNIDALASYEYDPNCKFCVANPFVIGARKSIDDIIPLQEELLTVIKSISDIDISAYRTELSTVDSLLSEIVANTRMQSVLTASITMESNNINAIDPHILEATQSVEKYTADILAYDTEAESVLLEKINSLNTILTKYRSERDTVIGDLSSTRAMISHMETSVREHTARISELTDRLSLAISMKRECDLYLKYLSAVHRNGVPLMVLKNVIHILEEEVNGYIENIVNFSVRIEFREDNVVGYIVSETGDTYPIELASGMERFIISTCIRASLLRISNMRVANFIFIDEGFGVLDKNNLYKVSEFLNNISKEFQFVLCVSHMRELKDSTPTMLSVSKNNGVSYISTL